MEKEGTYALVEVNSDPSTPTCTCGPLLGLYLHIDRTPKSPVCGEFTRIVTLVQRDMGHY